MTTLPVPVINNKALRRSSRHHGDPPYTAYQLTRPTATGVFSTLLENTSAQKISSCTETGRVNSLFRRIIFQLLSVIANSSLPVYAYLPMPDLKYVFLKPNFASYKLKTRTTRTHRIEKPIKHTQRNIIWPMGTLFVQLLIGRYAERNLTKTNSIAQYGVYTTSRCNKKILKPPPPVGAVGGYMFSGRLSVRPSVIQVVVLCFRDISSIC